MSDWAKYVDSLTQGESQDAVGAKVGVAGSTISRWRSGSRPGKPAEVAAFAVTYGRNVLEAFVAAGFLTPEQAGMPPTPAINLTEIPGPELAKEVSRRLVDTPGASIHRFPARAGSDPETSDGADRTDQQEAADAFHASPEEIQREQEELTEEP